jgi:hypothetical protein
MEGNAEHDMLTEANTKGYLICFKESLIVRCRSIWNHKNKFIFDGQQAKMNVSDSSRGLLS